MTVLEFAVDLPCKVAICARKWSLQSLEYVSLLGVYPEAAHCWAQTTLRSCETLAFLGFHSKPWFANFGGFRRVWSLNITNKLQWNQRFLKSIGCCLLWRGKKPPKSFSCVQVGFGLSVLGCLVFAVKQLSGMRWDPARQFLPFEGIQPHCSSSAAAPTQLSRSNSSNLSTAFCTTSLSIFCCLSLAQQGKRSTLTLENTDNSKEKITWNCRLARIFYFATFVFPLSLLL